MKIALVHSFYSSTTPSGENNAVLAQLRALQEAGHEVQLIAQYTDDNKERPLYKLHSAVNVASGHGASPLNELRAFQPDIVHVHNLFPNFSTSWLNDWSGPLVATMHNFRSVCAAGTLHRAGNKCTECIEYGSHRAIVHRCYKGSALATLPLAIRTRNRLAGDPVAMRADRVIALAHRSYQMFKDLGIGEDKLSLLPNFVDGDRFHPEATPTGDWVFIGRLTEEKGVVRLIKSWPNDKRLLVVGDGPQRAAIATLASEHHGITYQGSVPNSEIPKILSQALGLVFPSEWPEGAPIVYLEALSAGRPVVARVGNSVADDVGLNGTGLTYANEHELAAGLTEVTQNWTRYHESAVRHFEKNFSKNAWVDHLLEIYSRTIRGVCS